MSSSKRQKRQSIRHGAHQLRSKAGWDPTNFERDDPMERLRDLSQAERTESSFRAAGECEACKAATLESGRDDALCQTHLAEAMGF